MGKKQKMGLFCLGNTTGSNKLGWWLKFGDRDGCCSSKGFLRT